MADRITVYPEAGGRLELMPQDHVATGGEGAVYAKGDRVYKVYLEPHHAAQAGIERKLGALARLRHPGVAAPRGALRDAQGAFIGLELPRVAGDPLCRAFTTPWRDSQRFGATETALVTDAMREVMAFAHAQQALMVDANEMNWLLEGTKPVAIDVDSWQLPGFAATAIMASIRDPASAAFCEGSDWFAWAVVTFQLWTGLHPYKGRHPDFPPGALVARMQARASVFDARVRLPGAARPVAEIPPLLRAWYERTFASDERGVPPSARAGAAVAPGGPRVRVRQALAGDLHIERWGMPGGRVLGAYGGFVLVEAGNGLLLWDAVARAPVPQVDAAALALLPRQQAALLRTDAGRMLVTLDRGAGVLRARSLDGGPQAELATHATALWQAAGRLFAVVPGVPQGLVELVVARPGDRLVLAVRQAWPVAALSTQLFRGVLLQDCLGAPFVGVPEREGLLQAPAPVLRGYRVVDGLAGDRRDAWFAAVRMADGETVRLHLSLRDGRYALAGEEVVPLLELDGAANAAGVVVLRDGADLLVSRGGRERRVLDAGLPDALQLFSLGAAGIGGYEGGDVVKVSFQPAAAVV